MRLDKYISHQLKCGSKSARQMIAQGKVCVGKNVVRDNLTDVTELSDVTCEGQSLGQGKAEYIMLNKPRGCVSATIDDEHETVVDLIHEPFADQLHIAGRLDKESTGLLILTNDGGWSKSLTEPIMAIPKRYLVTTSQVIDQGVVERFLDGFYFAYEDVTTLPAELEILEEKSAIVTIYEGKYHQIKRMFHAVGNRINSLHRMSIGCLELDVNLKQGEYRSLTDDEIRATKNLCSK